MDERRQALGKTWAQVAREAGITIETLRAIRRGKNEPSGLTRRGLDNALHWEAGSVQRVLSGQDPRPVGSLPAPVAEIHGAVDESDMTGEPDSPITPMLRALLEQAQQRTNERLAALTEKVDQQNELIKRLLEDRKGA